MTKPCARESCPDTVADWHDYTHCSNLCRTLDLSFETMRSRWTDRAVPAWEALSAVESAVNDYRAAVIEMRQNRKTR